MDGEHFCCFEILCYLRRPRECMPVHDALSKRANKMGKRLLILGTRTYFTLTYVKKRYGEIFFLN